MLHKLNNNETKLLMNENSNPQTETCSNCEWTLIIKKGNVDAIYTAYLDIVKLSDVERNL